MRVYLDNCCYNRPFDLQTDFRIALETAAKMRVQALMRCGEIEYVWCDWFLTTDKGILKKLRTLGTMRLANPIDFIMEDD